MEIGPIWRAMMRNKTGAILIALQIAVTMAIMVNAISIIQERGRMMARPSGIDEHNIFTIASVGFAETFNERATIEEDLATLRALPGVVNAIQSNSIPLSGGGWNMGIQTEPGEDKDGPTPAVYCVDEHGIDTFGLNLLAGENFSATDIGWREPGDINFPEKTIITHATAEALFPDDPDGALGKTIYTGAGLPFTIIGIIEQMQAPWNGWSGVENVILTPSHTLLGSTRYIIRTEPGRRDELMQGLNSYWPNPTRTGSYAPCVPWMKSGKEVIVAILQ
jgi:putative ABC transport system permease protein